jgi:alpha-tubulin suppressor-like RCC1 family protein
MGNVLNTFQKRERAKSILWIGLLLTGFANSQALLGQQISAGYNYSFRICADSTAMAWGQNAKSQLGTTTIIYAEVPIGVNLDRLIAIDGGVAHTLALRADSTVWAWGANADGQLGLTDTIDRNFPTQIPIPSLDSIVAISAGGHHSMALRTDGSVWVWGANDQYQLGDSTTTKRKIPQQVSSLPRIVAICAGDNFSVALGADSTVWAWGANDDGQIGDGNLPQPRRLPFQLIGIDSVLAISAGSYHVLALQSNGDVWAWGRNIEGQLGQGNFTNQPTPVSVTTNGSGATALAAGDGHSLIIRQNGTVWATGLNGVGQLGLGNTTSRSSFTQIPGLNATAIACGENHSLAVLQSGSCLGWGSNLLGCVGNGTQLKQTAPTPIIGLCPTDSAVHDSVFTNYFRPTASAPGRWIAGELASSMRLRDGRMLWVFGKCHLDTLHSGNAIPCSRNDIANCLLVQDSLNPGSLVTLLDTVMGHPSRAYFQLPAPDTTHFVPGHGYQEPEDTATIFLSRYADDATFLGTWAARIGIVTMTVLDISRIILTDSTIDFGTAVIVDSIADQLYLYGSREDSGSIYPYLSRRILSNRAASWEFATPTGWSPLVADARRISNFPVSPRYSVTSLQGHHYLITQTPEPTPIECKLQRNILAYKSDDLKGPFVVSSFLATSEDSISGFPVFAFNAYAHPDQHAIGFSRCDSLLVSYNMRDDELISNGCSTQCSTLGNMDADSWRPKFMRVPYALLDTALSTTTVASFIPIQEGTTWTFLNTSQFATSFFWNFGDSTSTEPQPTHTFTNSGPHTVTLTASGCGSSDAFSYPLVHQDSPTHIASSRFIVFPQPSRGPIHIQGEALPRGPVSLELYTLLGEMIAHETHASSNGHLDAVLQYHLPAGMYLLRIATPQSASHFRIIIQ